MNYVLLIFLTGFLSEVKSTNLLEVDTSVPLTSNYINLLWVDFKLKYNKIYLNLLEETNRKNIFSDRVALVYNQKQRYLNSQDKFFTALPSYSDMTLNEIINKKTGFEINNSFKTTAMKDFSNDKEKQAMLDRINKKRRKRSVGKSQRSKRSVIIANNIENINNIYNIEYDDADCGSTVQSSISAREDSTMKPNTLTPILKTVPTTTTQRTTSSPNPLFPNITLGEEQTDVLNWTALGHVTPVKDQLNCAACWAFAVTCSLESQYSIKNRISVSLSEQFLVDCDAANYGCSGGNPYASLYWLSSNSGIVPDEEYPYFGTTKTCQINDSMTYYKSYGFDYDNYILNGDEGLLLQLLRTGPVIVAVEVTELFCVYDGGILYDSSCSGYLNHAVLLTGYGTENGTDYWIVKNSWGENFGEYGYIRMSRNRENNCGIATYGAVPYV